MIAGWQPAGKMRGPQAPGERGNRAERGVSRRARRARHTFALCATTTLASAERPAESASGGHADLPGGMAATAITSSMVEARTEPLIWTAQS